MADTILSWVTNNGIAICVVVGIIGIAYNFIQYSTGKGSMSQILITAVILIVVVGLIAAASGYSAYQDSLKEVASGAISGLGTEMGEAVGSGS